MEVNKSEFINGKYYTKNEAADLIGISYNAYTLRVSRLNKTPQEAFDMGENGNKSKKSEFINGKYYTKNEAADLIGISYGTYVARLSTLNKTPQEAYNMGDNGNKNPKTEFINGKYYTKNEAADLIGISYNAYVSRLVVIGKTPQEAFDMGENGNKNTKSEFINGKYYTKKEAAKLIGINRETYRRRLKAGKTSQEAFYMGKTKPGKRSSKSHFINGKYYTSKEAADFIGISLDAYKSRLKRGASPKEIFDKIKEK